MDEKKSAELKMFDRLVGSNSPDLFDGFQALATLQGYVGSMPGELSTDRLQIFVTAIMVEWAEFLQETNWKPWKPNRQIDFAKLADEFADTLAFLGNIIVILGKMGLTVDDLMSAYIEKSETNIRRFTGEVAEYRR